MYWRYLYLEFLSKPDRRRLRELIGMVWNPPPVTPPPDDLTIQFAFRRLRLSREGICVARRDQDLGPICPWSEIPYVELNRIDHARRDFKQLELPLPGEKRPIGSLLYGGTPSWIGAEAETIMAFLEKHLPADRIRINAIVGPPRDQEEFDRRMFLLKRTEREVWWVPWLGVMALLCGIGQFIYVLWDRGKLNPFQWDWAQWFVSAFFAFLFVVAGPLGVWAGIWEIKKSLHERRVELDVWQASQHEHKTSDALPDRG